MACAAASVLPVPPVPPPREETAPSPGRLEAKSVKLEIAEVFPALKIPLEALSAVSEPLPA